MNSKIFNPNFGIFHDVSDDRYHKAYDHGHADGEQTGYEKGRQEGLAQGYAQGKQDEYERLVDPNKSIEATLTGTVFTARDVSRIPHSCTLTADRATTVTMAKRNLIDPREYMTSADSDNRTILQDDVFTTRFTSGGIHLNFRYGKCKSHPKGTYTFTFVPLTEGAMCSAFVYAKSDGATLVNNVWLSADQPSFTFTANVEFVICLAGVLGCLGTYSYKLQLEAGTYATQYEPYAAVKYTLAKNQSLSMDSICPDMTLCADGDAVLTFTYCRSYGAMVERSRFWQSYQGCGSRSNYDCAFSGSNWSNGIFTPHYDIRPTSGYMMFRLCAIRGDLGTLLADAGVTLDTSRLTNAQNMFSGAAGITGIGALDFSNVTNATDAFAGMTALKTIEKLTFSETTPISNAFHACYALTNITIAGVIAASISFSACSGLSAQSVQSVIDHLADLTGKTARTLTFHATVGAKLTDAQKAAITAKNWTLVY